MISLNNIKVGDINDIQLFRIHADYLPIKEQKTKNHYYVYAWRRSEAGLYLKNKAPWLRIYDIRICKPEERAYQENLPKERRIIMNEENYLKLKSLNN